MFHAFLIGRLWTLHLETIEFVTSEDEDMLNVAAWEDKACSC